MAVSKFFDYYAILDVPTNASLEMIRVAYEVRMIELAGSDVSPREQERRAALLKLAVYVLGDEERRLAYDVNGECGYWGEPEPVADEALPEVPALAEPQNRPTIRPPRRARSGRATRRPGLADRLLHLLRGVRWPRWTDSSSTETSSPS